MTHLRALLFVFLTAGALRADTVVFITGREMEGKVLHRDENSIRFEVDSGVIVIPMSRVKRVDMDTPQQAEERERKKTAALEFAAKMKAEGKILYRGQWVPEEEVRAQQEREALAKKRAREAEDAAKKAQEAAARAAMAPPPWQYYGPSVYGPSGRRNRYRDYGYGGDSAYPYSPLYGGGGLVVQDGIVRSYRR